MLFAYVAQFLHGEGTGMLAFPAQSMMEEAVGSAITGRVSERALRNRVQNIISPAG